MRVLNRRSLLRMACAAGLLTGGALAGCGGGSSTNTDADPNPPQVTRGQYGSLEFTLSTIKTRFVVGEEVPFVFTVKNTGNAPVPFGDAAPPYLAVVRQGNTVVWDRWYGLAFGAGFVMTSLAPEETRRFEFSWNQERNAFETPPMPLPKVPQGTYRINVNSGMILENVTDPGTQLGAAPMDIVIR